MHRGQHRLQYLDGLRGIAAMLVVLWHYLGPTYAQYLPYGDRYGRFPLVADGWMGVEIFFLISGFVIFMTLERCSSFVDFMLRRWVRLFPAMLTASLLLLAIDLIFHLPGDSSNARPIDLIPGLLFVAPSILHAIFHVNLYSIDSVFWTLYVEMAFYVIFALLYFLWGWKRAVLGLILLFVAVRLWRLGLPYFHLPPVLSRAVEPLEWLGVNYFAWFASGALFYKAYRAGDIRLFWLAVAVGLLAAALFDLRVGTTVQTYIGLTIVVLGFAAVQRVPALQRILTLRPILFAGFISYPFYLIHSNLGVGLIAAFAHHFAFLPAELGVVVVIAAIVLLAWSIARFAEPPLMRGLRPPTNRLRAAFGISPS